MRLASELTPKEPIVERSPPRSYGLPKLVTPGGSIKPMLQQRVPVFQTPSGTVRRVVAERPIFKTLEEVAEVMDMSEEEAEEVLELNPGHVRRWLNSVHLDVDHLATPGPTPIVDDSGSGSSTKVDVTVIPEEPRSSTSGVTPSSMPVCRDLVNYGSDFDSEYDDEFDVRTTAMSFEKGTPNNEGMDEPTQNIITNIE